MDNSFDAPDYVNMVKIALQQSGKNGKITTNEIAEKRKVSFFPTRRVKSRWRRFLTKNKS